MIGNIVVVTDPRPHCCNGWAGSLADPSCGYTGGHFCDLLKGHEGLCHCVCGSKDPEGKLMGWSGGSSVFDEIIDVLRVEVSDPETRSRIYRRLIKVFEDHDCDTLGECCDADSAFALVWREHASDDEDE